MSHLGKNPAPILSLSISRYYQPLTVETCTSSHIIRTPALIRCSSSSMCVSPCVYVLIHISLCQPICRDTTEVWKKFCTAHLLLHGITAGSLKADSSLTNTSTASTRCLLHLHLMATYWKNKAINIFTQTLPHLVNSACLCNEDTNAGAAVMCQSWRSNMSTCTHVLMGFASLCS